MNKFLQILITIAISLLLAACQADEEKPVAPPAISPGVQKKAAVPPVVQEKPIVSPITQEAPAVSAELKLPEEALHQSVKVVEETVKQQDLKLEEPPPHVDLNLSDGFLKKLDSNQNLASDPPEQIAKKTAQERKIKVSGGVLLDSKNQDLLEKVDGGKVNISIPLE